MDTERVARLTRLIPAHAGKTAQVRFWRIRDEAHPRSRGENPRTRPQGRAHRGSSPLTRGKLGDRVVSGPGDGLIPAHAGKTVPNLGDITQVEAHPRSRGENCRLCETTRRRRGSSPLTRGKPPASPARGMASRLIPAHAGKTVSRRTIRYPASAHPRSRGENRLSLVALVRMMGSSPLTRGKQRARVIAP